MKVIKYEEPIDLFSAFRDKKSIKEFIEFMFNSSFEMSKMLESESEEVIFPIFFEESISMIQIDYVYFVYVLGRFYASKSGHERDVNKILYDYGLAGSMLKKI